MSDKRKKAHEELVPIDCGALFLRIVELERQVKYLLAQVDKAESAIRELHQTAIDHSRNIPFRIGGGGIE